MVEDYGYSALDLLIASISSWILIVYITPIGGLVVCIFLSSLCTRLGGIWTTCPKNFDFNSTCSTIELTCHGLEIVKNSPMFRHKAFFPHLYHGSTMRISVKNWGPKVIYEMGTRQFEKEATWMVIYLVPAWRFDLYFSISKHQNAVKTLDH